MQAQLADSRTHAHRLPDATEQAQTALCSARAGVGARSCPSEGEGHSHGPISAPPDGESRSHVPPNLSPCPCMNHLL